jgi:hypothetical protein
MHFSISNTVASQDMNNAYRNFTTSKVTNIEIGTKLLNDNMLAYVNISIHEPNFLNNSEIAFESFSNFR